MSASESNTEDPDSLAARNVQVQTEARQLDQAEAVEPCVRLEPARRQGSKLGLFLLPHRLIASIQRTAIWVDGPVPIYVYVSSS